MDLGSDEYFAWCLRDHDECRRTKWIEKRDSSLPSEAEDAALTDEHARKGLFVTPAA